MTGTLAQLIGLTTYGNAYLMKGNLPNDFYPSNTIFQFCKTVDFITIKKVYFISKLKEAVVADNPLKWFLMLKKDGCKKLRLYFQNSKDQRFT
jgi:hypothetical protein